MKSTLCSSLLHFVQIAPDRAFNLSIRTHYAYNGTAPVLRFAITERNNYHKRPLPLQASSSQYTAARSNLHFYLHPSIYSNSHSNGPYLLGMLPNAAFTDLPTRACDNLFLIGSIRTSQVDTQPVSSPLTSNTPRVATLHSLTTLPAFLNQQPFTPLRSIP